MSSHLSNTYIPTISKLYDPTGTKVGWDIKTRNNIAQLYLEGNQLKFKINDTSDIMILSETGITGEFGEATLPIQTGHIGEFLTTDGVITSWADPEIDTLLPDQSGNTGKFLTTDGSDSSWGTPIDAVTSVLGRTGDVVATADDYTWAQIDKTTSDIADITTKSHTSLSDIGSKKVVKSEFLNLDKKDLLKSILAAGLTGLFAAVLEIIKSGLTLDKDTLSFLLMGFVAGSLGYLTKNYGTNSEDKFLKLEPKTNKKRISNKSK